MLYILILFDLNVIIFLKDTSDLYYKKKEKDFFLRVVGKYNKDFYTITNFQIIIYGV